VGHDRVERLHISRTGSLDPDVFFPRDNVAAAIALDRLDQCQIAHRSSGAPGSFVLMV
jgi:hypothetical protein